MTEPTPATIKRLFAVSGNKCAFPGCTNLLVDPASGKVTGRICHIKARRPSGSRYDPDQTPDERRAFENLILMCPIHHDIIDFDLDLYTVERLRDIKTRHEVQNAGGSEPSDDIVNQLLRKDQARVRFAEVRRYLTICLEFIDLVSIPTTLGPENFGPGAAKEWIELISNHYESWKSLPINTSARTMFVKDEKVLQWLEEIDVLKAQFYLNYQSLIKTGSGKNLDDKREEVKRLAAKVAARLDQLLYKI